MKAKIQNLLKNTLTGSERTQVVKKNILGSFLVKGLSILTSLILVPLTIHLLDQEKYGIWMTIFSIVTWFNMMDIGIGNGFRNKFAVALAVDDRELAKEYMQTFYSSMAIISIFFFIFFAVSNFFLNWYTILNLPPNFTENITFIVFVVFAMFCLQIYTKNISTVLLSIQKTTYSNLLNFLGNVLAFIFILFLQRLKLISLFSIAVAFMSAPIIVFIFVTFIIFYGSLKEFRPKLFILPKKKYLNDLVGIGLIFFFIQISTIVMFSSGNIIITQLLGPASVTPYNVAFRLYSSVQACFTIIITPFWAAFTEANTKKDFGWIRKSIRKLIFIWMIFSLGIFILFIISPIIFRMWVGKTVVIPLMLSLQFAFFVIILSWINLFVFYVNGVGKIRLQLYISVVQCIINIPLSIFFVKHLAMNTTGIILAINLNLLISAILLPIQYRKLINNNAHGIWSK